MKNEEPIRVTEFTYTLQQVEEIQAFLKVNGGSLRISRVFPCVRNLWPKSTDASLIVELIERIDEGKDFLKNKFYGEIHPEPKEA